MFMGLCDAVGFGTRILYRKLFLCVDHMLDLIELIYGVMQVTNKDKHLFLLGQVVEGLSLYACA